MMNIPLDELLIENNQQINLPFSGARINIISNSGDPIYPIQLIKQYFPTSQIYHSKNIDDLASTKLIIYIADLLRSASKISEPAKGSFLLKTGEFQKKPALLIKGKSISGIIYAINELGKKHLTITNGSLKIPPLNIYQSPSLPYRFFWTWDHSTIWYLEQCGMQEIGFANPYSKPAEGFLQDYYRLIDFMSLNRINGLTIYGFLRDSHGGIEAAQQLCRYATERGVRIFPGVGINCYGGIYWEGVHQYNLSTWLEKNPELREVHRVMLEKIGCHIDIANNGIEALNKSEKHYDIIFMDIGLPDISGIKVSEKIREKESRNCLRNTPIIALTAYFLDDIEENCKTVGINKLFSKPISIAAFQQIIFSALKGDFSYE